MKKWITQQTEKCRDCQKEISQGSYVWLDENEEIVCQDCFFTEDEAEMLSTP